MAQPLEATNFEVAGLYIFDQQKLWNPTSVDQVVLDRDGIIDDRHYGPTRLIRGYESVELKGTEVANDKQISLIIGEDACEIAEGMDLPVDQIIEKSGLSIGKFMAEQLAANVLLGGVSGAVKECFRSGTLLAFGKDPSEIQSIIRITEYNPPCKKPIAKLLQSLGEIGIDCPDNAERLGQKFLAAGAGRRGWVGSVYKVGTLSLGESVFIHQPLTT